MLQLTSHSDVAIVADLGALLQASFLGGWILGGVSFGFAADRFGRTYTLCLAIAVALGATLCMGLGLTHSLTVLSVFRCIAGFGVGGIMVLSTTLGAEVLKNSSRMWLMGVLANSYAFGIIGMGQMQQSVQDWTLVARVLAIAFAVLIPLLLVVARNVAHAPAQQSTLASALRISSRDIVLGAVMFGSMLICLWATFSWLPSWASDVHPGSDAGESIRTTITMVLGMGAIVGSLLSGLSISRLGRVRTLMLCFIATLSVSVPFYLWPSPSVTTMTVCTGVLGVFFGLSQASLSLYIPELFPAVVRATSVGICFNAGRVLTAVAVFYVGVLASALGGYQPALLMFTAPLVVGAFLCRIARESNPADHL